MQKPAQQQLGDVVEAVGEQGVTAPLSAVALGGAGKVAGAAGEVAAEVAGKAGKTKVRVAGKVERAAAGGAEVKAPPLHARVTGAELQAARREFDRMKPRLWREEAVRNPGKYTPEQLQAMRAGEAPKGLDGKSMEIHHKVPLALGGKNEPDNFIILTFTQHRAGSNFKLNHPGLW
jgi:hypothetical protein